MEPRDLERYARHIVLREIGGPGQAKLRRATVAVIGAGGPGAPALLYLAAAGIGRIRLIDDDVVSLSNLQRQVIFGGDVIGQAKVAAAAERLQKLNDGVALEPIESRLSPDNAAELLRGADIILDGSDSFETRRAVNAAAVRLETPLVSGAIGQWDGQISLFHPAAGTPCYACLFPTDPPSDLAPSCAEAGVVGALAGMIGSAMALEAVKHITGAGRTLAGRLMLVDALDMESRVISIARQQDCAVCARA